jgi:hypothetical protein
LPPRQEVGRKVAVFLPRGIGGLQFNPPNTHPPTITLVLLATCVERGGWGDGVGTFFLFLLFHPFLLLFSPFCYFL